MNNTYNDFQLIKKADILVVFSKVHAIICGLLCIIFKLLVIRNRGIRIYLSYKIQEN